MLKLQCGGERRREVLLCLDLRVRGMEHANLSTLGFECRPDCLRDLRAALIQSLLQGSGRRCRSVLRFSANLGKELGLEKNNSVG